MNLILRALKGCFAGLAIVGALPLTCTQHGVPGQQLDRIDSLTDYAPQEALAQLQSLRRDTARWDEAERVRYLVLTAKATVRSGESAAAQEPAMRRAVAYYTHHGTEAEQQNAWLFLGDCLRDASDYRRAMACYGRLARAAGPDADTAAVVDALTNEGRLLTLMLCCRQAISLTERAVLLATQSGGLHTFHLGALAEAYMSAGNNVACRATLQRAAGLLRREPVGAPVLATYVELYAYCGDTAAARRCLQRMEALPPARRAPLALERARMTYYAHIGEPHKANLYGRAYLAHSTTMADSVRAYQTLVSLSARRGDLAGGFAMANTLNAMRLRALDDVGHFVATVDGPTPSGAHHASTPAGMPAAPYRALTVGLGLLLLLGCAAGWWTWRRSREHARRLRHTLEDQANEVARLRQSAEAERERPQPEPEDMSALWQRLENLKNGRGSMLGEEEWMRIARWADGNHPDFKERMERTGLYRNRELRRMCYLMLMGYNRSDIWHILQTPRSTTYDRMARIQAALGSAPQ